MGDSLIGRTSASGADSWGSSPCPPAKEHNRYNIQLLTCLEKESGSDHLGGWTGPLSFGRANGGSHYATFLSVLDRVCQLRDERLREMRAAKPLTWDVHPDYLKMGRIYEKTDLRTARRLIKYLTA